MSRTTWLLALCALTTACGASATQINRAKSVRYQTEYTDVWNAVRAEVTSHYKRIKSEDAVKGFIVTEWTVVEKKADATSGDTIAAPTSGAGDVNAGDLFQARVRIVEGGPPWQIVVEGEAAEYRPNQAMLRPYKRGASDEPHWVEGRINEIYLGVYKRLEGKAVDPSKTPAAAPAPAPEPTPAPAPTDPTPPPEPPPSGQP